MQRTRNSAKGIDKCVLSVYNNSAGRLMEMKTKDLIKLLEKNGWYFKRNGGNHDIYTNGESTEMIPRHSEVKENPEKAIIKRNGLK